MSQVPIELCDEGIFRTADARYAELAANHGYQGNGTLTALWPQPEESTPGSPGNFGIFENGGMYLYETYFEVVARSVAGDGDGAYRRLKGFSDRFAETSWWGANTFNIEGNLVPDGSGEPYLQDMVMVPAALVQGILGVQETWNKLTVSPALPTGWDHATADIRYKGRPFCVSVADGNATTLPGPCLARVE